MAADGGSGNGSNVVVGPVRSFARMEQTFPTLTDAEIARMRRFGELRSYKDGEPMFETGKAGPGMFVVLSGHVAITERDGLGHVTPIVEQGPEGRRWWWRCTASSATPRNRRCDALHVTVRRRDHAFLKDEAAAACYAAMVLCAATA
jgi:hypothetical protein